MSYLKDTEKMIKCLIHKLCEVLLKLNQERHKEDVDSLMTHVERLSMLLVHKVKLYIRG